MWLMRIVLVVASATLHQVAIADVNADFLAPKTLDRKGVLSITVSNSITIKDYVDLMKLAGLIDKRYGTKWLVIADLNTTGGSVDSALKIGSFLRKKDALANVPRSAICMSSCVYILAGATHRSVEGIVGIHRPYEPDDQVSSADAQRIKYKNIGDQIVRYLRDVNISARLYEDSLVISPDRLKILSANELQAYGLNENDPYADEADAVKLAQKAGITRKEYGEREIRARQGCRYVEATSQSTKEEMLEYMKCKADILEGKQ
jgi:hypothetical protein